jgi:hypothetical protein
MLSFDCMTVVTQRYMGCYIPLHPIPPIPLLEILIHLGATWVNGISQIMSLSYDGLSEISHIQHTNPVPKSYSSLIILYEIWGFILFDSLSDFLYLYILQLSFAYLLLKDRFYLQGNSFSMSNYPQVEALKLLHQFIR